MKLIGALSILLLLPLSSFAEVVDYEVLKGYSPTLYRVVKQYEREVGRSFSNYQEIDEAMTTDRFLDLWKSAGREMCATPANDNNLACIRLYGGVGARG